MARRSGYGRRVGRVSPLILLLTLALAAPAGAAGSLASAFGSLTRRAHEVEVHSLAWFPVRGTIDFGEADARFGVWRGGHRHEGQDVFADAGTPLVSVREGEVVEKGDDGGRGNYVAIWTRAERRTFVYLHMERPTPLREGAPVEAGQRVGAVGCTGSCWGDHLHLELRRGRGTTGRPLDPMPLLTRLARRAR